MFNGQRIRAFLYYSSVFVFCAGLPVLLCFAFGYKFDRRTHKFTRTGLLFLKTQPAGADVYLDKQLLGEKTPLTLNELLPGNHEIRVELPDFYPWSDEVNIEESKVTRLDKVILFPVRNNLKKINKSSVLFFWLDHERGVVYYVDKQDRALYKVGLDGEHHLFVGQLLPLRSPVIKYLFSADRNKLLYFNAGQIGIIYLQQRKDSVPEESSFVLDYPKDDIKEVYWHSDSYHLVLVTARSVEVMEARPGSVPTLLIKLNRRDALSVYDINTDALLFMDTEKSPEGVTYGNLYKLGLDSRTSPFYEFIKIKNEE